MLNGLHRSISMSTPLFSLPEIVENQSGKYITHNEALALIEGLLTRVLSRTNSGAPTSPNEGDTYIVDDISGDWSLATLGNIAHYYSGAWHFLTPIEGFSIWCVDENTRIYYDGSGWKIDYSSRIDLNLSLGDQDAVGVVDTFTVDVNATGFGAALYIAGDGNMEEVAATGQSTMPCMALALETGTGAGKQVLLWGRIRNDSWSFSVGSYIYVGATAGQITDSKPSSSGDIVQVIGVALASNIIFFNPSYVTIEIS